MKTRLQTSAWWGVSQGAVSQEREVFELRGPSQVGEQVVSGFAIAHQGEQRVVEQGLAGVKGSS